MKVLFHSTSSNNVFHVINSLGYLGGHEVGVFHYDGKWNEACAIACQSNPQLREVLQAGRYDQAGLSRERVSADGDMIRAAEQFKPDVQIYISAWEGMFVPSDETLTKLNGIAPLVHFCFDQSDPPWWEADGTHGNVIRYHKNDCFALQVGIDGGFEWPGGRDFYHQEEDQTWSNVPIFKGLTLLTPIDPRPFEGPEMEYGERPYGVAYAGNAGGPIRGFLVNRLQRELPGFVPRLRDDQPGSYGQFAQFLKMSRIVINVPFTGSGRAKHVKGRVLEAGLAGAALLEWRNPATRMWFTPRADYEEYGSIDECLDMARWLLGQSRRCRDMAESLSVRVRAEHSPQKFWTSVFAAVPARKTAEAAEQIADKAA